MKATASPISAAAFERVFIRNFVKNITRPRRYSSTDEHPVAKEKYQDLANWREVAWKALKKKESDDAFRRAIESLRINYREVLFLRDVKNFDTAETAWVLDITAGAVRTRLSRARMHVCGTLRLLFCDGFGSSIGTSRNPHLPGRDAHFS
jgi:DNA-directed RNA polymerase specialized sigma24 family protein